MLAPWTLLSGFRFYHIIIVSSLICQVFGIKVFSSLRIHFHGTIFFTTVIPSIIVLAGPPLSRASPESLLMPHLLICMPITFGSMFSWQSKFRMKKTYLILCHLVYKTTKHNCVCILRIALYMYVSIYHTTAYQCLIQCDFDHIHCIGRPRCVTAAVIKSALKLASRILDRYTWTGFSTTIYMK